jgi:hypothetical protein
VIHAAGTAGAGVLQLKTREQARAVLLPKVVGAEALCAALVANKVEPDFVALFSSLFGSVGGVGQVDYAAANAFLDTYAGYVREKYGLPFISMGWGAWSEVGMAARAGHTSRRASPAGGEPLSPDTAHPLLDRVLSRSDEKAEYAGFFAPESHWCIEEHRIGGAPTVPGTALLEMTRAAFVDWRRPLSFEFRDVFFLRPLTVDSVGVDVRVRFTRKQPGWRFEIGFEDSEGKWQAVAAGAVAEAGGETEVRPRAAVLSDTSVIRFPDGRMPVVRKDDPDFLRLGRHWEVVQTLHIGEQSMTADLALAADCADDVGQFGMHPSLLDMATGPVAAHLLERVSPDDSGTYLPSGYRRIRQFAPMSAACTSHLHLSAIEDDGHSLRFDIDITGADAPERVLVRIEDFVLRRVVGTPRVSPKTSADPTNLGAADSITPAEGVDLFERMLAGGEAHWVVLPVPLSGLVGEIEARLRSDSTGPVRQVSAKNRDSETAAGPETPTQRKLTAIFEEVLGTAPIGIHDNFFELGGDSVIGIQIVARAKQEGLALKPNHLFSHQSVAELAGVLESSDSSAARVLTTSQALRNVAFEPRAAQVAVIRLPVGDAADLLSVLRERVAGQPLFQSLPGADGWEPVPAPEVRPWMGDALLRDVESIRAAMLEEGAPAGPAVVRLVGEDAGMAQLAVALHPALALDAEGWSSLASALAGGQELVPAFDSGDEAPLPDAIPPGLQEALAAMQPLNGCGAGGEHSRFVHHYGAADFPLACQALEDRLLSPAAAVLAALALQSLLPAALLYETAGEGQDGPRIFVLRAPQGSGSASSTLEASKQVILQAVENRLTLDVPGVAAPEVSCLLISDLGVGESDSLLDWSRCDLSHAHGLPDGSLTIGAWYEGNRLHVTVLGEHEPATAFAARVDTACRRLLSDAAAWTGESALELRAADFADADISPEDLKALLNEIGD